MAVEMFLEIDGFSGTEKKIRVLDYSLGLENQGESAFHPVSVTKLMDSSSSFLFKSCSEKAVISKLKIVASKRKFESQEIALYDYKEEDVPECPQYLEYTFNKVVIHSVFQEGVHGQSGFAETFNFSFDSFHWTYHPSNEDGTCYFGEPVKSEEFKEGP